MLSNQHKTKTNPFIKQVDVEGYPTKKALQAGATKEHHCADGSVIVLRWYQGIGQVEHISTSGESLSLFENTRISACIRQFKHKSNGR